MKPINRFDDADELPASMSAEAKQGHIAMMAARRRKERSPEYLDLIDKAIWSAKFRRERGRWPDSRDVQASVKGAVRH